jgi:predicted metal-dependent HD superfamily phosphohydrolase
VPRPTYLTARANVLTTFLERERIYASAYYHERLEAPARENVACEVAMLKAGVIPGEEES